MDSAFKLEGRFTSNISEVLIGNLPGIGDVVIKSNRDHDLFYREAHILATIKNVPRVPQILEVDDQNYKLIIKKIAGDPLDLITKQKKLRLNTICNIALELSETLNNIHDHHNICHYDITPRNIIFCGNHASLIDFGLAFDLAHIPVEYQSQFVGTTRYFSPEKVRIQPELGKEADVFALGAILFELISSYPLINDCLSPNQSLQYFIENRDADLKHGLNDYPQQLQEVIWAMLAVSPQTRPTMSQVANEFKLISGQFS